MQATPQAPQAALSPFRSTHAPLHAVRPALQVGAQIPAVQTWPAAHTTPHPPQFCGSFVSLTHSPEQPVVPCGHTHDPLLQISPGAHAWPQPSQLAGSLIASTQIPPQSTSCGPHEIGAVPVLVLPVPVLVLPVPVLVVSVPPLVLPVPSPPVAPASIDAWLDS
jgi:hypothetical protein